MFRNRKKKGRNKEFTVYIYESEYQQIQAWVDKHQNLETGGDLFGLWSDDHTAVVQLVLGPGKHCTRTSASFYQDVEYLERVGNLLTNKEGLCHIGEWHSHHRLGLKQPSGGDENTVWNNMDRYGIHRFCLFIATIDASWRQRESTPGDVDVRGFHFKTTGNKNRLLSPLKFIKPSGKSPFRSKYEDEINQGVESVNEEQFILKLVAPVQTKEEKLADQAMEKETPRCKPEVKKQKQSWLRGFIDFILYVCSPVMLCCKRSCSALRRCLCCWMWFLNDKKTEDTKTTAPEECRWISFRDLIHLCCPICWFIQKPASDMSLIRR